MKSTSVGIGEAASRFGLAAHVLRHWETVGLLAPDRVVAGRRRYGASQLYRIAAILRAKKAGLGLDTIRELLCESDPTTRSDALHRHRTTLVRQIEAARSSLALIDQALDCEHDDVAACPRFRAALAQDAGLN
jgi:MerR family transcriptional regulator, copper efflux regulator